MGTKIGEGDPRPDLSVSCPWLPALDGASFDDLCDEDRIQVAKYLATIYRRSGKDDVAALMATALGNDGTPLANHSSLVGPVHVPDGVVPVPLTLDQAAQFGLLTPIGIGVWLDVNTSRKSYFRGEGGSWYGPFESKNEAEALVVPAAVVPKRKRGQAA